MSDMFSMMFPDETRPYRSKFLLSLLESDEEYAIGRFRDAWMETDENGELEIALYTRNGGGNREHHNCPQCTGCVMEQIVRHPLYLRDADDSFDSTYATIYFKVPEWTPEHMITTMRERGLIAPERVDMSKKWQDAIAALDEGPLPPHIQAFGDQLAAALGIPTK